MRIFAFLIFLASLPANAGGWISSGGELFRDAHNPWFVKNTEKVSYCVNVAEGSFSLSKAEARRLITDAFRYWQSEFRKLGHFTLPEEGFFNLGSQTFEEVECSPNEENPPEDLRFLLGYETLSKKEAAWLVEPRKYIGVSVRTNYDEQNLRGKGFVLISSDKGKNAYLNSGSQIEEAWRHPKLVSYVLLHEIGHIFGFPHTGSGLMSEVFLEQVINKNLYESFLKWDVESMLHPNLDLELCKDALSKLNVSFFTSDPTVQCLEIKPDGNNWEIWAKKNRQDTGARVGTIKNISMNFLEDFTGRPAVLLQLTDKQKVFSGKDTAFRPFMVGPIFAEYGASGMYVVESSKEPKSVYLKLGPSSFSVIANSGKNKVEPVLTYLSPLGLSLLIPPTPLFPYGF